MIESKLFKVGHDLANLKILSLNNLRKNKCKIDLWQNEMNLKKISSYI